MYQKIHDDHDYKEPSNTIAVAMESNILYGTSNNSGLRRLFASGQSPTGKIIGGYLQAATLKSSCIVLFFAHSLKIHPIEF